MSKTLHELLKGNASDEEVLALIANGVDVNEINTEDSYTRPLQIAVNSKRSEQVIRALVKAGADVNACATEDDLTDDDREAVNNGELNMREDLFDYFGDLSPLYLAVSNNDIATMTLLVNLGAEVNQTCRDSEDEVAPITAANDKETLEALVKLGANVNLTYGDSAAANKLGWDIEQLDVESLMVLLRAGAGFFSNDNSPGDRINSYIENHPEADGELVRSFISANTLEYFNYDPFGDEDCDEEDWI